MVKRTRLNLPLYVPCLSCLNFTYMDKLHCLIFVSDLIYNFSQYIVMLARKTTTVQREKMLIISTFVILCAIF